MFKKQRATIANKIRKFVVAHDTNTRIGLTAEGYHIVYLRRGLVRVVDPATGNIITTFVA